MWIRSQDKGLYAIRGILPPYATYKSEDKELNTSFLEYLPKEGATPEKYELIGIIDGGERVILGEYDTKEAIKVVDEIEELLESQFYHKINSQYFSADGMATTIKTQYVYQMPKKGEVE